MKLFKIPYLQETGVEKSKDPSREETAAEEACLVCAGGMWIDTTVT